MGEILTIGDLLYSLKIIQSNYESDFGGKNKDLEKYLNDLHIRNEKGIDINIDEVEDCVKKFWKKIILEFVEHLLNKIENRTTTGGEFAEIKVDLINTQQNIPYDNPSIDTLQTYYKHDLKKHLKIVKEKIKNEKLFEELNEKNLKQIEEITRRSKRDGRLQGLFFTIFLELIIGYYFNII